MTDTRVIYEDLPTTIGGCVKETDGFYTIILNSRMTREQNKETYVHEQFHIDNGDFDREHAAGKIENEAHGR